MSGLDSKIVEKERAIYTGFTQGEINKLETTLDEIGESLEDLDRLGIKLPKPNEVVSGYYGFWTFEKDENGYVTFGRAISGWCNMYVGSLSKVINWMKNHYSN